MKFFLPYRLMSFRLRTIAVFSLMLCVVLCETAHAALDWRKLLGISQNSAKPKRMWKPRRGPVFDWKKLSVLPLKARVLKTTKRDGIITQEVMFHAEKDGNKSVDIFAFYSYPARGKKLPAFVWIEGGLAPARAYRTEFGARRGYATLAIDFPQPGYRSTGNYPINLGMYIGENPKQAPIYHGAVALLRAVSFLEAQPQVDKNRIGMAGSSWGGFYTTLMTGVDPRIKASACLFGSGNLQMGNMWWDAYGRSEKFPAHVRDHWRTTLDPAWRLPHCKTPIAWFTATNDWFFWMPAMMRTFHMAGGPKSLTLVPNWDHALPPEIVDQLFAWLDTHLKSKPPLIKVEPIDVFAREGSLWARWNFSGPRRVCQSARQADVIISWGEGGNWNARCWKTLRARLNKNYCEIKLPATDGPFYIAGNLTDKKGYRVSTPLRRIHPRIFGASLQNVQSNLQNAQANLQPAALGVFSTDGAEDWGQFEWSDCLYLRRHNWWKTGDLHQALTIDAFEGKKALVFTGGSRRLPLLRFTEGYKHQFSFWAKSDTAVPIGVRFNAGFYGTAKDVLQWRKVGTNWTKITFDIMPHEDLHHRYNVSLVVPPNAQIKMDNFSFRPIAPTTKPVGKVTTQVS